jgi:leader peptidase (prepilin peptidase)/N-methyltransferase
MLFSLIDAPIFIYCFIFLLGASLGSFINLAKYRMPRSLSVWKPARSFCDQCQTPLPWTALIPILGFFIQKRKCSSCEGKIPWSYPLIELFTGLVTLSIFSLFTLPNAELFISSLQDYLGYLFPVLHEYFWPYTREEKLIALFALLWVFYSGLLLSLIDLDFRILPNSILLPGIPINMGLGYLNPNVGLKASLIAGIGSLIILLAFCYLYFLIRKKEGLGMGDVKYIAFFGFLLGPSGILSTVLIASVLGSITGVVLMITQRGNLSLSLPFGPFLAFGGFISTFMIYINISH